MSTMTPAQLTAWIEDLHGRLERGELANVGAVQLQPWLNAPDVERYVRATLRQIEGWRARPLEERLGPAAIEMQRHLADELTLLYERLVEGKPCPPVTYRTQP
jgi:hypothetical protein